MSEHHDMQQQGWQHLHQHHSACTNIPMDHNESPCADVKAEHDLLLFAALPFLLEVRSLPLGQPALRVRQRPRICGVKVLGVANLPLALLLILRLPALLTLACSFFGGSPPCHPASCSTADAQLTNLPFEHKSTWHATQHPAPSCAITCLS